jgi:hypothetical protein
VADAMAAAAPILEKKAKSLTRKAGKSSKRKSRKQKK